MSTAPVFFSFHESSIDDAKAAVGQNFFTTSMDLVEPGTPYDFRFAGAELGALSVGRCRYDAGIRIGMSDLQTCYYVNLPTNGAMRTEHRRASTEVSPGRAAVFQPVGDVRMTTSDRYDSYAVRVDRRVLEGALEDRLGHPPGDSLELGLLLDLQSAAGLRWARLVRLFSAEARTAGSALTNPLVAAPLHDAVIDGLLTAAEHRYREALEHPVRSWGPGPVYHAIEAMHAQAHHPFTPARLARITGVSVRSLQEGFRRHVDVSPMAYLRRVRMERAHHDLRAGDPTETTVTDVALRWGFTHLGRFAADYRSSFGVHPSQTLRDGRER